MKIIKDMVGKRVLISAGKGPGSVAEAKILEVSEGGYVRYTFNPNVSTASKWMKIDKLDVMEILTDVACHENEFQEGRIRFHAALERTGVIKFRDDCCVDCSIQESSIALEKCIQLGIDKPEIIEGKPLTQIYFKQEKVAQLIPILQWFVEKGQLPNDNVLKRLIKEEGNR